MQQHVADIASPLMVNIKHLSHSQLYNTNKLQGVVGGDCTSPFVTLPLSLKSSSSYVDTVSSSGKLVQFVIAAVSAFTQASFCSRFSASRGNPPPERLGTCNMKMFSWYWSLSGTFVST